MATRSSLPISSLMKKKHVYLALAIIAGVIVVKLVFFPSAQSSIPTYTAKRGTFNILVIESGAIRAKQSSTVTAPRLMTGGNLQITYLAAEGSIAHQEEVLVRFDPSAAMKRIQDKQTELKTAMADLDKLKAEQRGDESQAKTEYENAKLAFQLAEIAKDRMQFEPEAKKREAALEFERAKLTFEQARLNQENKSVVRKSELGNLQLRISQIQSDIGQSMKEMEQLSVKAPISGLVVLESNWSTGRKMAVGDQPWPGMPIISLPDLTAAQVEVSVNEMDIAKLKTGQKVDIIPDAFPDRKFSGTVTSISQIGREKGSGSNIKVFDIIIDIDRTDPILKPGITTTNKIIVATKPAVISVPIASVIEEEKKTFVFVKKGSGFSKREVTLGERNDNFVIVKKGVAEGDQVALRNPEEEETPKEEKGMVTPTGKK
jgi:HlyD family secretion protein